MQGKRGCNAVQRELNESAPWTQRCGENAGGTYMDSNRQLLIEESRRRNLTPIQVIRLAKAGGYDISENTIRNFYDDAKGEPTQHTIDVLSAVIFGTEREDFDSAKAYQYYCECVEARISAANTQQRTAQLEAQCESLAARLSAYENAVGFYRRQLDAAAREREMLLEMLKK